MRVKIGLIKTLSVGLCLLCALLSGCSGMQAVTRREVDEQEYGKTDAAFDAAVKGAADFYPVAAAGDLQLLVQGQTAGIAVKNTRTGVIWTSNPADAAAGEGETSFVSSQFSLRYTDDKDKTQERFSYADSVKFGQYDFYPLPNGVRVNYLVNEQKKVYLVPPVIGKERFEKVLAALSEEDRAMLSSFFLLKTNEGVSAEVKAWQELVFPALRYGDIYVLSSGYSHTEGITASDLMLQMIEPYFVKAGYTKEDLKFDTAQNSLEPVDEMAYSVELSVEYTLDEKGLTVRVPQKSILYDEGALKLTSLSLLPFMGAAGGGEEGYLLVPDGSGALIRFNNGKKTVSAYEKRVYGPDYALQPEEKEPDDGSQIYLPVYGICKGSAAMLAVIEQGDAAATLHADVGGKLNAYNYIYPSFTLVETGVENNAILNQTGGSLYQKQPLGSDLQIRYLFIEENGGGYGAMAARYRAYLLDTRGLTARTTGRADAPFLLNTIGAVSYSTTKLGIPVETEKPLTTYAQAASILEKLRGAGLENLVLSYSGWMNKGLDNTAAYRVSPVGKLGGKDGFLELAAYAKERGIALYPEVNLSYVTKTGSGYNKNADSARNLSGNIAKKFAYNLALERRDEERYQLVVSPRAYEKMAQSFLSAYKEYGVDAVSLPQLSRELNGDYHKADACDRQAAQAMAARTLSRMSEAGYGILADGANAYALRGASFVSGVPSGSGNHYLFDETVPFYQMVLHGTLPFAGTPLNQSADFDREVLRCIEYGTAPAFQWIYEDNIELKETEHNLYNVHYALWFDEAVTAYKKIDDALGGCWQSAIVSHERLSANVYKTTYDNGRRVYVNYGGEPVVAEGVTVGAGDYAVREEARG